jgi:hypothetical protein
MLVGLAFVSLIFGLRSVSRNQILDMTYKRNTAVCAPADLGLIGVDEDPGMTERAASTVAGNDALVCPANRLLVDEFDSGVWARLQIFH